VTSVLSKLEEDEREQEILSMVASNNELVETIDSMRLKIKSLEEGDSQQKGAGGAQMVLQLNDQIE
jgi:hypothetical protein